MLIFGPSGSSKTNALVHMLLKPLIYYDKVYLYLFIYEYSNSSIKDVDELENKLQKVVIFDDYICDKNQDQIIKYFIQGRHKNCSVIYSVNHIMKRTRM